MERKNRKWIVLLIVGLMIAMTGCGGTSDKPASGGEPDDKRGRQFERRDQHGQRVRKQRQ